MPIINVSVKPRAKQNKVEKLSDVSYKIWVTAPAEKGKANQAVIALLAKELKLKKSQISIIAGFKNKEKIIKTKVS